MNEISFSEKCYELISKVPKGKVTTYQSIAKALKTKAYRAVGNAMNKNPNEPKVPCHRVIKSNGEVGGYAHGQERKISILKKEGIDIISNRVDLSKYEFKLDHH